MAWTEPVLREYKGRAGLTSIAVSLLALCIDQMMEVKNSIAFTVCKDQLRDRGLGRRQGFNYPSHPASAAKRVKMTLCILRGGGGGGNPPQPPPSAPPLSVKKETKKRMRQFSECFILH